MNDKSCAKSFHKHNSKIFYETEVLVNFEIKCRLLLQSLQNKILSNILESKYLPLNYYRNHYLFQDILLEVASEAEHISPFFEQVLISSWPNPFCHQALAVSSEKIINL